MERDSPIRWVRRNVFRVTQEELAAIGGVSRPRVCCYESRGEAPPYDFLKRVRDEARARALDFDADWFFEVPMGAPSACVEAAVRVADDVQ
jgi:transcriptional regulator with XRE-family HTH domain